jgi:hypothetical protein
MGAYNSCRYRCACYTNFNARMIERNCDSHFRTARRCWAAMKLEIGHPDRKEAPACAPRALPGAPRKAH